MREVERLLTAASVEITPVDPQHDDAKYGLAEYVAELNRLSTRHFDPSVGATTLPHEVRPPAGQFFVIYLRCEPVGCGAVEHHRRAPADIKRMWITPHAPGLGLAGAFSRGWRSAPGQAGTNSADRDQRRPH